MGYYDQIADGSDKNEFRLWIEGIDAGFVTSSEDIRAGVNSTTNFEPWYVGLQREGMEFSQDADITQARIKASTMTLRIADVDGLATSVFAQNPSVVAYLTASIGDMDTDIPVTDSTLFSVGQLVYCGTETWYVSAKPTSVSLTVSRTWRGTFGVSQYVEDGDRQRTPEVTDKPRVFEGRRCRVYCKGEGDTGWTAVFYGTLATEPRLTDLTSWEINIDPITKILDQDIGPDESGLPARGIYYPTSAPFRAIFEQHDVSSLEDGSFEILMIGFWESQEDFLVDLNAEIATKQSGSGVTMGILAAQEGPDKISFLLTGTDTPWHRINIWVIDWHAFETNSTELLEVYDETGVRITAIYLDEHAKATFGAPVPRGYLGRAPYYDRRVPIASGLDIYNGHVMFLGGGTGFPTAINGFASISGTDGLDFDGYLINVPWLTPPGVRSISLWEENPTGIAADHNGPYNGKMTIRFAVNFLTGSVYRTGSVGDLFQSLIDLSTEYSSLGYVPFVSTTDLAAATSIINVNRATSGTPGLRNRLYSSTKANRLGELISEECKLIGCYLSINSGGQIVIKQVAALGSTDTPVAAIDESNTLMSVAAPTQERSAYGLFNSAAVKTGFEWSTGDYQGPVVQIRSVQDFGSSRRARTLMIEPKATGVISEDEINTVLSSWFAMFAKPYTTVTVDVPFSLFQVYIGDTVTLVSDKLPDYDTGERGWTVPKRCMVTGRRWNLSTGVGTLTMLVTGQTYAGYTPSVYVTAHTGGATVTTTTITVNDNLPTPYNNTSMLPDGTLVTDFFATGDRVVLHRFNSTAPSPIYGIVTAATSTTIDLTLDSAWTPSAYDWILTYDLSNEANLTTSQRRYAYVAGNDRIIDFDGSPTSARLIA